LTIKNPCTPAPLTSEEDRLTNAHRQTRSEGSEHHRGWPGRGLRRWAFEGRLRIHTSAVVTLEDLGLAGEGREFYAPAGWLTLNRILPRREVTPQDVFLDLGSGMGRMVIRAASRYSFARVIGVEISEELHRIAQDNLTSTRARLRSPVQLVCADVLDYQIPDDVSVVFLNNPFRGAVFRHTIDALTESLDRAPRRLRVIYRAPREEAVLADHKRARRVRARGRDVDRRVVMFEVT
jgi:predicted RNA methylase